MEGKMALRRLTCGWKDYIKSFLEKQNRVERTGFWIRAGKTVMNFSVP
jgi:hypothetical protein